MEREEVESVVTIVLVEEETYEPKQNPGQTATRTVVNYVKANGEFKSFKFANTYLEKAVTLREQIKELKPKQKVGLLWKKNNQGYPQVVRINLDPAHPIKQKDQKTSPTQDKDRQASIVSQMGIYAAIQILTNKLSLDTVEATARDVVKLVTKISAEQNGEAPQKTVEVSTVKKVATQEANNYAEDDVC